LVSCAAEHEFVGDCDSGERDDVIDADKREAFGACIGVVDADGVVVEVEAAARAQRAISASTRLSGVERL
jgi:hypothetical protein